MRCSCLQYKKNKDGIGYYSYPCGQCIACRLNKVRDWTIRLMHENRMHDKSVFLTLTYDPEHLPEGGTLVKDDVQRFMKRLRKQVGKVRFFLCGEYGEKYSRPHYHLILFGISSDNDIFKGKKYDFKKHGYWLNSKLWPNGTMFLGDVTYGSCRYVASYVNKKVFGKNAKSFYEEKGVIPEFTLMSRKPGIGGDFLLSTEQCCSQINLCSLKEKKAPCLDFTKINCLIRLNSNLLENARKKNIVLKTMMSTPCKDIIITCQEYL